MGLYRSHHSDHSKRTRQRRASLFGVRRVGVVALGAVILAGSSGVARAQSDVQERLDELEQQVEEMQGLTNALRPGTTKFLLSGYASATFNSTQDENSAFSAQFNPIFNWILSDRVFFTGELEFELEDDATEVGLEYATLVFVVNDYLTIVAGKPLTPLSTFKENLHAPWINKMPDQPLFAEGPTRLVPTSSLAFMARGALPIGKTKLTYSAYVSNGFSLSTTGESAGKLGFSNFGDINNNKAIGGRIGFFPIPELEIAYAFTFGEVDADGSGFGNINAIVQDIAISFVTESEKIGGQLDVKAELVISDVEDVDFGMGAFDNMRYGGYAQVAYRPTMSDGFIKDLEGVVRYDWIDQPSGAPVSFTQRRIGFGVNYWVTPSAVFKVAYEYSDFDDPAGDLGSRNGVLFQFAVGF